MIGYIKEIWWEMEMISHREHGMVTIMNWVLGNLQVNTAWGIVNHIYNIAPGNFNYNTKNSLYIAHEIQRSNLYSEILLLFSIYDTCYALWDSSQWFPLMNTLLSNLDVIGYSIISATIVKIINDIKNHKEPDQLFIDFKKAYDSIKRKSLEFQRS